MSFSLKGRWTKGFISPSSIRIYPGAVIPVGKYDLIEAVKTLDYFESEEIWNKDWRLLVDEEQKSAAISEPVKLTISREAFNNCGDYKKNILKLVSKRAAVREFEQDQIASGRMLAYLGGSNTPQVVIFHFSREEFLKVTSEYPWLLDSNLGESSD